MSDIQTIIQSIANANDQGKDFLRAVRKMPEAKRKKLLGELDGIRAEITKLSKTATSIRQAVSPKDSSFIAAGAKARAAKQSAELAQKLGGFERVVSPASSIGGVKGREFCVTGKVEGMERDELEELIKSRGGLVRNNLSKGVDVLVIGSAPGPKKVSGALERRIRIVKAPGFIKWIKKV